jgi:hypothetical protein
VLGGRRTSTTSRSPALGSFAGQRAADSCPARLHLDRIKAQARARAAAESDAAELVGVLVHEADTDAVVERNAAGGPELWRRRTLCGGGEASELVSKPERETICDLIGERRDRILRLVKTVHGYILGRVHQVA